MPVTNMIDFITQLPELQKKLNGDFVYRGHANKEYKLIPSAFRTASYFERENELYDYVLTECANDFSGISSHCEILSKMQHYGIPTRLLDITDNPFVALYMACEDLDDAHDGIVFCIRTQGNIKAFDSDVVTILACLPKFSIQDKRELYRLAHLYREDKKENIDAFNKEDVVSRLLHEIKKEKPAFENKIVPSDLFKKVFVRPKKNNARIIRQSGGFILWGLIENSDVSALSFQDFQYEQIEIAGTSKKTIIDQLSCFGISKATLFPELEKVAEHVKKRFNNRP